jgi:hypothetical protein
MDVKWKRGLLMGVSVLVLILAMYFTLKPADCQDYLCFQENMGRCSSANYINDDFEAAWKYSIKGPSKGSCEVEVTLMMMKEGELSNAKLEGKSMTCSYPLGTSAYPERNLDMCHGILKEEIQKLIIERLHGYVLSNLGEIRENLRNLN